ncbi:MAG: DMT family transporter [Thermodesulfovibrionales bacterium]|nr:DMT family transporter [Thermodesulfovibrionales bacterium]
MSFILIAIFLWSSLGIFIRLSQMPVQFLIFVSCIISSLILSFFIIKCNLLEKLPSFKQLLFFILIGAISLVNSFTFFYAYQNTTIANAVLTHYTAPVVVAVFAPLFLKEKLSMRIITAIILSTAGLWIMLDMSPKVFFSLLFEGDKNTYGIIAGLISGIAYGMLIIIFRFISQKFHPLVITFIQNIVIASILSPFIEVPNNYATAIWAFLVMGVVHSTIAPILYFRGMREVSANRSAILGYLEPVCAIILGVIFLQEAITLKILLGGCMILFSGYLTIK